MDKNIQRRRLRKQGEAAPPPKSPPRDSIKRKYNLRDRTKMEKPKYNTLTLDTLTASSDSDDDDDSTYAPTEDIESVAVHDKKNPIKIEIHIHSRAEDEDEYESEDEESEDEYESDDEDDDDDDKELTEDEVAILLSRSLGYSMGKRDRSSLFAIEENHTKKKSTSDLPIHLSKHEKKYFEDLPKKKANTLVRSMKKIKEIIGDTEVPLKFKVLDMEITDDIKAILIRKIDTMTQMGPESGEGQKMRVWVETLMRVPFGKVVPLPVTITDGHDKCGEFLKNARSKLDSATYGMEPAKMQIMQIMAQWISNPSSVGNCIALQGNAGIGKTSFARNGIASVLNRPFMFFSLGGASDVSHYMGHSFTYEGSTWGRIIDSIIQAKCMNPVLYFDELDKISGTPHGEEITSMLIHLTDRSQNSQYHDRYFAGVDFDLSKCLFVFSYNDESKINPILKDRMAIIKCSGYKDSEKKIIIANYVWKEILNRIGISRDDLSATEEAAEYIIREYSNDEPGMRTLIRVVETIVARINLIRISDKETAEKYKFYMPIVFPMKLDVAAVKKLLIDYAPKDSETWRSMYN